ILPSVSFTISQREDSVYVYSLFPMKFRKSDGYPCQDSHNRRQKPSETGGISRYSLQKQGNPGDHKSILIQNCQHAADAAEYCRPQVNAGESSQPAVGTG